MQLFTGYETTCSSYYSSLFLNRLKYCTFKHLNLLHIHTEFQTSIIVEQKLFMITGKLQNGCLLHKMT